MNRIIAATKAAVNTIIEYIFYRIIAAAKAAIIWIFISIFYGIIGAVNAPLGTKLLYEIYINK